MGKTGGLEAVVFLSTFVYGFRLSSFFQFHNEPVFCLLSFFPYYLYLVFDIKMNTTQICTHSLCCDSIVVRVSRLHSEVNVCPPSGINIGTDRRRDKRLWINPFLNAFRDVSAPLVTHTRDLCESPSLLLGETHLQTLKQTLERADN